MGVRRRLSCTSPITTTLNWHGRYQKGRKREFAAFGWDPASIPDPEKQETFLRSKLNWDELFGHPHAEMLAWYRKLIQLRRSTPCLNNGEPGNTVMTFSEEQRWFSMSARISCCRVQHCIE